MKKSFFVLFMCLLCSSQVAVNAQSSQKTDALMVRDTRDVNEPPSFFKQEIRLFKNIGDCWYQYCLWILY